MEGLTLRELQIGLCCLDPSTVHGGLSAQFRCQFIFYFYNSGREYLHFKEFKYVCIAWMLCPYVVWVMCASLFYNVYCIILTGRWLRTYAHLRRYLLRKKILKSLLWITGGVGYSKVFVWSLVCYVLLRIFCADQKQGISLDLFLSVVGQLKFRGTSVLFRLPHPPVSRLNIGSTVTQLPNSPMVTRDKQKSKISILLSFFLKQLLSL